jgi:predicted dehydrogenase
MNKVKWGVIGAGGIARRRTIPEGILAAENSELCCVFDVRDCEPIAKQFGVRACSSINELLWQEIDAVYVATPVHLHREHVLAAAAAKKHVLCEKPLGLNVSEVSDMLQACSRAGVQLGVGLMMRFHALHAAAKKLIDEGKLGRLVFGRAQLSCWYPQIDGAWRQDPALGGGGSLIDLGAHCIDLLETVFGPARSVFCATSSLIQKYDVEDTAIVTIEFASGAKGVVDCLFNVPDESSKNRLEIYGAEGSLLAEGTIGQSPAGTMTFQPRASSASYDAQQTRSSDGSIAIVAEPVNLYRAEVEAFAAAILENRSVPVDGSAGEWNQRLLAACYESARSGRMVQVNSR